MKIVTWNIQQGGGTRIGAINEVINQLDADVVVLTEYKANRNGATKPRESKVSDHSLLSIEWTGDGDMNGR